MKVADDISDRSLCSRAKIGAVIVDATNRVVSTGYNGPPSGFVHNDNECYLWCPRAISKKITEGYDDCVALHAEANALMVCDRSQRESGSIFVKGHICFGCAKLIANSGLLFAIVKPDHTQHRNAEKSYRFLKQCGIDVIMYNED